MTTGKNPYKIFNDYCLRTPLFSVNFLNALTNKKKTSANELKTVFKNSFFNEALYLASPELHDQALKWCDGKVSDYKKQKKIELSLLKYITRICTRCTPFGLFALCTTGTFDKETNILPPKINLLKRYTRFDMTFLSTLSQELLKNKIIRKNLLFYQNTSLYKVGNHFRYVEYHLIKKQRKYLLVGVVFSEYLEKVLNQSKTGKTIHQLATSILDDEIKLDQAIHFIEELIDKQVLVSELEISITGKHYFEQLVDKTQEINNITEISNHLCDLKFQLEGLDTNFTNKISSYQKIIESTKSISKEFDKKYLFQTDCFSIAEGNSINISIKKQLKKALILFNRMSLPSANKNIVSFKRSFSKRFEEKEVSLGLALDTETGIGYGIKKEDHTPMLDNLSLSAHKKRYKQVIWTDTDSIIQKKLIESYKNRTYTIQLTKNDFKEFPENWEDLPDTFSSIIEILTIGNKEKIFMSGIEGSSAISLLGRFCYGDKRLLELTKEIARIEEIINSDKIIAEIVHLPKSRTGNILQRPILSSFEIPYLGKSDLDLEHQIPIDDILISIRNDTIVLRSKKLNKEILPRLGNAHNYNSDSLPIYQFLCELQSQNKRSNIGFIWNSIFRNQSFLPRVEFEDIIISKAQWNVKVDNFKKLYASDNLIEEIKIWQQKFQIPKLVELIEGDNKLLINLHNETSISMLFSTIKNRTQFVLEEFLFHDNGLNDNYYCNQIVVSFYNDVKTKLSKSEKF